MSGRHFVDGVWKYDPTRGRGSQTVSRSGSSGGESSVGRHISSYRSMSVVSMSVERSQRTSETLLQLYIRLKDFREFRCPGTGDRE